MLPSSLDGIICTRDLWHMNHFTGEVQCDRMTRPVFGGGATVKYNILSRLPYSTYVTAHARQDTKQTDQVSSYRA